MADLPQPDQKVPTDPEPAVTAPATVAGLLLLAREELRRLRLPAAAAAELIAATGASRSQAYARRQALVALLPTLDRPPGRPPAPVAATTAPISSTLARDLCTYLMDHPGCVHGGAERRRYSDGFRRFLLALRDRHAERELAAFAAEVAVPLATIEAWLKGERQSVSESPAPAPATHATSSTIPRIQMILDEWHRWEGGFGPFCDHVQSNLHIPYGRTAIAGILESQGARTPKPRTKHSPDEKALRGAFETFFAGAQWVGDGMHATVAVNDETFDFNVELDVDTHSAAFVGAKVTDEEDAAAVVAAFVDGVQTTGAPPLDLLLDNRASNHAPEVAKDIGAGTMITRSTLGRPQNKAHVEGAFGLFQQTVPELRIRGTTPRELARAVLRLVVQTFGRTINHRPRGDRRGRSRVEIYQSAAPTPEQIAEAKAALLRRHKQNERAEETRRRREDPVVLDVIDRAFARLAISDPKGNVRAAIARYPLDAVIAGVATYEGKQRAGSLPDGVDGRYLLGIVRNIFLRDEGEKIAAALLKERLHVRDSALAGLAAALDVIQATTHDAASRMTNLIDSAMSNDRRLDRLFWLGAAERLLAAAPDGLGEEDREGLLRRAVRRVLTAMRVPYADRLTAVRRLTEAAVPLG